MADENEKIKRTVPALERTAKGIAVHAQAVQEMQWDKDKKVFKDPFTATLALFTYAKITASLLAETEERLAKKQEVFDKRIAEFETRIAAMEKWKAEAEAQTMEMVKGVEEMMASGKMPQIIEQIQQLTPGVQKSLAPVEMPAAPGVEVVEGTVTQLKQPKKKAATDDNKNGGAA